ncbi:TPA: replication-associated recombination protein A [Bacillus cereus]|uniref:replication-associated recombination protein A n=1 Tax=Bacillus sp. ok061 TaxID=1761766 RepID=UPI000CDEB9A7|nr:replication-associated recombination protein A [Bacillus sp. ok061]
MRPSKISDVVGQDHVIGPNTALYKMIQNGHIPSILLYGDPGTGKTSMAFAISNTVKGSFYSINATNAGKKDIDEIIQKARFDDNAILFIDEIHKFNRSQQDTLLKALEEGVITLIGATTENPFHSVNPAIRSRCGQIKQLKILTPDDILKLLNRALSDKINGLGKVNIKIEEDLLKIISNATGDGRSALNILEDIVWASKEYGVDLITVKEDTVIQCIQNKGFSHDKKGDIYYSLLSSFQKSIRGSDTDAALYYLARLLEGGDLVAICRRLLVIGYEDIGLANPALAARVLSAIETVERIGLPEARIPLSVIVIELCLSPKSNSAYKALDKAINDVKNGKVADIPDHLKDNHYQGAESLGHGIGYQYPHDFPNGWVYQDYLPNELVDNQYYMPKENGEEKLFSRIYSRLEELKNKHKKR